jgi:hypothetical protein
MPWGDIFDQLGVAGPALAWLLLAGAAVWAVSAEYRRHRESRRADNADRRAQEEHESRITNRDAAATAIESADLIGQTLRDLLVQALSEIGHQAAEQATSVQPSEQHDDGKSRPEQAAYQYLAREAEEAQRLVAEFEVRSRLLEKWMREDHALADDDQLLLEEERRVVRTELDHVANRLDSLMGELSRLRHPSRGRRAVHGDA